VLLVDTALRLRREAPAPPRSVLSMRRALALRSAEARLNAQEQIDDTAAREAARHAAHASYEAEERAAIAGNTTPADPRLPRFSWVGTTGIFEPLPPTVWRVPGLQLCAGRPSMLAAYGASGKTLVSQSLLLCAAARKPIWGEFRIVDPLRVGHIDHEQGNHATRKRYQRLRIGHGIHRDEVGDRLRLVCFPPVYLNTPRADDVYARECEGLDLVLLDALRGATPGVDENDSKIRECIDRLTRVSEKTGTAFVVLHQAPKPKDKDTDRRTVARGSSAIFDASGSVFDMTRTGESPLLVTHEKAPAEADGSLVEKFYLSIEDVAEGDTPKAGVRVVFKSSEEAAPELGPRARRAALQLQILRVIAESPGCSIRFLRGNIRGSKDLLADAIENLLVDGRLANLGTERSAKYHLKDASSKGANGYIPTPPT